MQKQKGVPVMVIVDCIQGSEEWFAERVGRPSASRFSEIITTTGQPSKQAEKYLHELAGERVVGFKAETYINANMARGIEMEAEARQLYELMSGVEVEQVGICYQDEERKYGASPDGLVGESGLLEIKCPTLHVSVKYLLAGSLPTDYFQQVQGQLFVTGREWVDFMSYYPGLKPMVVRVQRDEKFIAALKNELDAFCDRLDEVEAKLRELP
jgi:putative phage-type endonuclease